MSVNQYLKSRIDDAKKIVDALSKEYEYVSVLGSYVKVTRYNVSTYSTAIDEIDNECGFVIKVFNNEYYSEYACNDIVDLDLDDVKNSIKLTALKQQHVNVAALKEESLTASYNREDESTLSQSAVLEKLSAVKDAIHKYDSRFVNAAAIVSKKETSKIFVSAKKTLDQYYSWTNAIMFMVIRENENIKNVFTSSNDVNTEKAIAGLFDLVEPCCKNAIKKLNAKPIVPGVYDVITHPSISGLIAHEAFGHGVEMDMFVKNRAKAKNYVGKYVASPLVNMRDGAASTLSAASYFFDDDGVLASDTQIIKDGVLVAGISDALSALQLGSKPTGNGRRESFKRKAYTRMTNTFFDGGNDELEDMIASIKHGYMLFDTNNGMEDPKSWQIQCTAEYGLEIVDGKFSGEIVSPVVISGSVLDLLNSISMVSKDVTVTGLGSCGKGHKEWVNVSDGGPYLKARVKLG